VRYTEVVIIGGGQAGLAMSRCLSERGIGHVVLERGRVAERWRSERWDSLRLLTPNWLSRLPGYQYDGPDPNGYMTMPQVVAFLEGFAAASGVPVETGTTVLGLERDGALYRVETDRGTWTAPAVVMATGYCDTPFVPEMSRRLPDDIVQIVPSAYRNPDQLPEGGVLVVGASSSGIQLAGEIRASGRPVTVAVGRHTRLPRRYRGRDILWWMDRMGVFSQRAEDVYDLEVSRQQPSLQLVGRPDYASLDLPTLKRRGVRLAGRLVGVDGAAVTFDDDLMATAAASDGKLAMLLGRIDEFIAQSGMEAEVEQAPAFEPSWPEVGDGPLSLDLRAEGVTTVLWATGFKRRYPWLKLPVLDARGEIRHDGGVTEAPGLYVMGLQFLRRRKSAFIDGVADDARELAVHLEAHLRFRGLVLGGTAVPEPSDSHSLQREMATC